MKGYSAGYRAYSAKGSLSKPTTATSGTQYEPDIDVQADDVIRDEIESMTSNTSSSRNNSSKTKRQSVPIKPINVTFPFPITPDKFRADTDRVRRGDAANQFLSYDRRRSISNSLTSMTPRRSKE